MKRKVYAALLCMALLFSSGVPAQAAIKPSTGTRAVYDGKIVGSIVHLRSTMSANGWTNVICSLESGTWYYDHGRSGNNGGIRWRHITVASDRFAGWSGFVDDRYTSQGVIEY